MDSMTVGVVLWLTAVATISIRTTPVVFRRLMATTCQEAKIAVVVWLALAIPSGIGAWLLCRAAGL